MHENAVNIQGNRQRTISDGTSVALSPGVYDVWATAADTDVYIAVNQDKATAAAVSPTTGYLVRANNTVPVVIPDDKSFLGVDGGELAYHKVK